MHIDVDVGRIFLPGSSPIGVLMAGIDELRVYFSGWPLNRRHAIPQPVSQPEPGVGGSHVVSEYQAALAAGDVEAIVATFEPRTAMPASLRGIEYVHRGRELSRASYAPSLQ